MPPTHSVLIGYIIWIFGFTGCHRFYCGRPVTGTIWFFTFGLFLIGWIVDLFLIPHMARTASATYRAGPKSYDVGWVLLSFLGVFGIHRFYMGKWISGLIWFFTGGLFLIGYIYDLWTFNELVDRENRSAHAEHTTFET